MSNLIKAAEELEYVPKETLIQMAQTGDSRFPPYLVLAEIQRRTQNEKAYSAMQPPPTTTVAEEKVAEFAQSGLGGMVSPPFSPPEDLSMSPPMQMAASGGLTGYANQGRTTYQQTFRNLFGSQFPIGRGRLSDERLSQLTTLGANPAYIDTFQNVAGLQFPATPRNRGDFANKQLQRGLVDAIGTDEFETLAQSLVDKGSLTPEQFTTITADYVPPEQIEKTKGDFEYFDNGNETEDSKTSIASLEETLDLVKSKIPESDYTPLTKEDRLKDLRANALMQFGSLIAGATDRASFGRGLSDVTQNLIAARRDANKEIRADASFKREQSIQDLTLATAIRKVQVEAQKANTADERNRLLEIQYQLQLIETITDPDERKRRLDALLGGSSSGLAALNEATGAS